MKYRIPGRLVAPIREAIQQVCVLDAAGERSDLPGGRYRLASLYLDSPRRRLYFETRNRAPHRAKLRVRRYDNGPYFLEIKRKSKDVIAKSRAQIPAEAWPHIMFDRRVLLDLGLSEKKREAAERFLEKCLIHFAEPATVVRYEREAWVSNVEDYARVTFDYRLCGAPPVGWKVPIEDGDAAWRPVDDPARYALSSSGVVLELKCTTAVPYWMTDLVRRFRLERSGFSKYATCLEGTDPMRAVHRPMRTPAHSLRQRP